MCEQACPNHLALPAVIDRIRRGLSVQSGLSSSAGAEMLFCWF
jgi:hypothetical protein